MQKLSTPLPTKKTKRKHPLSIEIEEDLLIEIKKTAKLKGLKLREIVEYGFNVFLETSKNEGRK